MKKVTFVYGFHNDNQIDNFILSTAVLLKNKANSKNNLLILISDDINIKYTSRIKKHLDSLNFYNYSIKVIDFNVGARNIIGKFYWLFSPYLIDSDYFVQLDNDFLITFNINKLIKKIQKVEKNKNKDDFLFLGVKEPLMLRNGVFRQTVKEYFDNEHLFEKNKENYINTGLVIFNNKIKNFYERDELAQLINKMISEMYELHIKSDRKKFLVYESDQNFIHVNFKDKIYPILNEKYNSYGFGTRLMTNQKIVGYHFNWWFDGKKIDFISILKEENFEEMKKNLIAQLDKTVAKMNENDINKICKRIFNELFVPYKEEIDKMKNF